LTHYLSKHDLQKILSKQIFRKDDVTNAMESGIELKMKQTQMEAHTTKTMRELNTPIMNTDVPTVNRITKESFDRSMSAIPNTSVRQDMMPLKENNKRNLAFKMEMYNKELFEC
jgi:hypothetical protein